MDKTIMILITEALNAIHSGFQDLANLNKEAYNEDLEQLAQSIVKLIDKAEEA